MEWPVEICCPKCKEVVILVWEPILGHTLIEDIPDTIDTPIKATDNVEQCPICFRLITDWITLIKEAGL